jgi:DNA-directed RNA polymerase II subunit RPB1
MVNYDGTVRNSLGDVLQFVYGEDGMDGAYIERQRIETFHLNNEEFEHNYRVDVTDPAGGFLPGVLQVGIDDSSLELQARLDEEYAQLLEDRRILREFIFPRTPEPTFPTTCPSTCNALYKMPSRSSTSTGASQAISTRLYHRRGERAAEES